MTATVVVDELLEGVGRAVVELGYVNTYRYRWAGRNDMALKHDDTSFVTAGQVGTDYGSDRETSDWVFVLEEPLTVAGGRLESGTQQRTLRIPSWAPGSSATTIEWQARLRIECSGRDVSEQAPITVLVASPVPDELPLIQGESFAMNTLAWDLTTERPAYRVGEEVRGVVRVTPREPVKRTASLGIFFQRENVSHPLGRTPGATAEMRTRPTTKIAEDLQLREGETTEIAFAAVLPEDCAPTTEAVHCTLSWFVVGVISFKGATGGIEHARRAIVVNTA